MVAESEWDEQERSWMLALAEVRDYACPGCGGDLTETLAYDDWMPTPPVRCHACEAIAIAQEANKDPHPSSLTFGAVRRGHRV